MRGCSCWAEAHSLASGVGDGEKTAMVDSILDHAINCSDSERGACDPYTGTCTCRPGRAGEACELSVCSGGCSGRGTCVEGRCSCRGTHPH